MQIALFFVYKDSLCADRLWGYMSVHRINQCESQHMKTGSLWKTKHQQVKHGDRTLIIFFIIHSGNPIKMHVKLVISSLIYSQISITLSIMISLSADVTAMTFAMAPNLSPKMTVFQHSSVRDVIHLDATKLCNLSHAFVYIPRWAYASTYSFSYVKKSFED